MATKVKFGNKVIQLPGVYSRIISGQNNPPRDLDYGKLLIIDNDDYSSTLTGKGMLGGAGVAGELASGKSAIYTVNDITEFRDFCGANWWWKAAEGLFNPDGRGNGVSQVHIIKPATTAASNLVFTPVGGGTAGGSFKVKTRDEGTDANGVLVSSALASGYAYLLSVGVLDPTKWIYQIWKGTYKGLYTDGFPYDEVAQADAKPVLVAQSVEFNNVQELINWAKSDQEFGKLFVLDATSAVTGTGVVDAADILANTGFKVATGGTATYNKLAEALVAVKDLDYNYILTTCSTANPSTDADIAKIVDHITNEAKFDKYLIVGGDDTTIATTNGYSVVFNTAKVNLVHGAIKKSSRLAASGFRTWGSFFHAAYNVGRILGLAPEVPLTYKALDIDGLTSLLTQKEQLAADSAGTLVTIFDNDFGKFINLHDVNTTQNSAFVLNADGTSHLIQIERIKAQLNKELMINAKLDLLSDPSGVNRSSLTEQDAVEWTKTYLQRKLGTLLVAYRNVTAQTQGDVIFVDYEASPNSEIKSIFFTGRLYL